MQFSAGTKLGRYIIAEPLGKGGMGEVYRARDDILNRDVAIKVLSESLTKSPELLKRFEREAKAVAALSHPNIFQIYDFGIEKGVGYAVMELLEGETLRAAIKGSRLDWRKSVQRGIEVAEGLAAAHSKGIVHRDLKPENIFLTSDGGAKILDFGLAQVTELGEKNQSNADTISKLTESGKLLGTIPYMSPEQLRGEHLDTRTDIFSFGCVLYEMISGHQPFSGKTAADTISAVLNNKPVPLKISENRIPPDVDRLIQHCLEKDRTLRFQSANDLAINLKAILKDSGPTHFQKPRLVAAWIIAAILLTLTLIFGFKYFQSTKSAGDAIHSLAILPLQNAGGDPETDYLSDGITESLINNLSQLPELKVTARTTVFTYKGLNIDPIKIGRELGVHAVMTGKVIQRGENLEIQADLIDVKEGSQLWGQHYNRKVSDVFELQDEISKEISKGLLIKLSIEDQRKVTKRYTENTEAYQLYLKGRYHWNKRTPEGLKTSIDYFQQSTDKDPVYPLAYAGLADSYVLFPVWSISSPSDAMPKAKAAAQKAIELDETLAEAHAALAYATLLYDWDPVSAEKEFKYAIHLNSKYPNAHFWYAACLASMNRTDEAIAESKRAQEIDPLSLIIQAGVVWMYHLARKNDLAIVQSKKILETNPNFLVARYRLGISYEQKSMEAEAIVEHKLAVAISDQPDVIAKLGRAYAASGNRPEAYKILRELDQMSKQKYVSAYDVAEIYVSLGEKDQAFRWLQKAYEERAWYLAFLRVEPRLDSLRSDPRFESLMRNVGFLQ